MLLLSKCELTAIKSQHYNIFSGTLFTSSILIPDILWIGLDVSRRHPDWIGLDWVGENGPTSNSEPQPSADRKNIC